MNTPSLFLSLEALCLYSVSNRLLIDVCLPYLESLINQASQSPAEAFKTFRFVHFLRFFLLSLSYHRIHCVFFFVSFVSTNCAAKPHAHLFASHQLVFWTKELHEDLVSRLADRICYLSPLAGTAVSIALSHRINTVATYNHTKLYINPDARSTLFQNFGQALRHLSLDFPSIDDDLFAGITSSASAKHLESVNLNAAALETTRAAGRLLSSLTSITKLKLRFQHDLTRGKLSSLLKGIRRLASLETLALFLPSYNDPAILKLFRKRRLPALASLSMGQKVRMLFESELVPIAQRLLAWPDDRCSKLRRLQLYALPGPCLPYLCSICVKFPALERFLRNSIDWPSFQQLSPLLPRVRWLSLEDCPNLVDLTRILVKNNPNLEYLFLEGAQTFSFCSLTQLSSLQTLHISAAALDQQSICSDIFPASLTGLQIEVPWGTDSLLDISQATSGLTNLRLLKGHLMTSDSHLLENLSSALPLLEEMSLADLAIPRLSHAAIRTLEVPTRVSSIALHLPMLDSIQAPSLRAIPQSQCSAPSLRSIASGRDDQVPLDHLESFKYSLQRLRIAAPADLNSLSRLPLLSELMLTNGTISSELVQVISSMLLLTKLAISDCTASAPDVLDNIQHRGLAKLAVDGISNLDMDINLTLLPNLRSLVVESTKVNSIRIRGAMLLQKVKLSEVGTLNQCILEDLPRLLVVEMEELSTRRVRMEGLSSCRKILLNYVRIYGKVRVGPLPLLHQFTYGAESFEFDASVPAKFRSHAPGEAIFDIIEYPGSEDDDDDDDEDADEEEDTNSD
jgi:hypothetical protein